MAGFFRQSWRTAFPVGREGAPRIGSRPPGHPAPVAIDAAMPPRPPEERFCYGTSCVTERDMLRAYIAVSVMALGLLAIWAALVTFVS